jgi:hypothetical protein
MAFHIISRIYVYPKSPRTVADVCCQDIELVPGCLKTTETLLIFSVKKNN